MSGWPVDLNVEILALHIVEESGFTRGTPESWADGQDVLDLPRAREYPSSQLH